MWHLKCSALRVGGGAWHSQLGGGAWHLESSEIRAGGGVWHLERSELVEGCGICTGREQVEGVALAGFQQVGRARVTCAERGFASIVLPGSFLVC